MPPKQIRYDDRPYWRQIQRHLPGELHLTDGTLPDEEQRHWRGHHVHVDCGHYPIQQPAVSQMHDAIERFCEEVAA